jgi:dihydropteroate synthase
VNIEEFKSWLSDFKKSPLLMGILNVTPDSFSDGGRFNKLQIATDHALKMENDGADIIDIGGESTRPGAVPIGLDEELIRVIPIIGNIRKKSDIVISIDTYKSEVADEAIRAGANIINDISGLRFDMGMVELASSSQIPVIVMHMLGTPQNMQKNPKYDDVMDELKSFFTERIDYMVRKGIVKSSIIIDPGIGFGKTIDNNFTIIKELQNLSDLGCPILIGPSRKSFIGNTLNLPLEQRIEGTSAAVTASIMNGAKIIRAHDVIEIYRVIKITEKICGIS